VHTQNPQGKIAYAFLDLYEWPHDANLIANIMLLIFNQEKPLPPVLYLQLDNCFRENKNKYMLGFCSLLVEFGIFKKVSNLCDIRKVLIYSASLFVAYKPLTG
jgi:hypothetical protein